MNNSKEACEEAKRIAEESKKESVQMVSQEPSAEPKEGSNNKLASDEELWNQVEKLFKIYDADGDGKLNKEETTQYIKIWSEDELGYSPGKDMIDMVLEELDDDNDGFVQKKDIFLHLKRTQETREN